VDLQDNNDYQWASGPSVVCSEELNLADRDHNQQVLSIAVVEDEAAPVVVPSRGTINWRPVFWLGKLLVSTGMVTYLVKTQRLGMGRIVAAWHSPVQTSIALGLLFLLPIVLTFRWYILLRALRYPLSFRSLLNLTFMAAFFDTMLPGGAADAIRGYYLDRNFRLEQRARALSSVVVDRFLGVMGLILAALVALVLSHTGLAESVLHSLELSLALVGCASVLVLFFLAGKKNVGRELLQRVCPREGIRKTVLAVYDAFRSYSTRTAALLQALSLSVLGNVFTITSFVLLGSAMGASQLKAADYFCLVPVGLFVAQIPISPGGIGVGHLGFYSLFRMAGSNAGAEIFSLFIVARSVSSLPGLFCFLLVRSETRHAQKPAVPVLASALDIEQSGTLPLHPLPTSKMETAPHQDI
jgi:uncharacterized protein (TIRG00374 family)